MQDTKSTDTVTRENQLTERFGLLLSQTQLAELLGRSTGGLRYSLSYPSDQHTRDLKACGRKVDLVPRCRQLDQPFPVHPQQRYPTAHILEAAVGLAPVKHLAHPIGQLLAVRPGMAPDELAHPFDLLRTKHPTAVAFVRRGRFHAGLYTGIERTCPAEKTYRR